MLSYKINSFSKAPRACSTEREFSELVRIQFMRLSFLISNIEVKIAIAARKASNTMHRSYESTLWFSETNPKMAGSIVRLMFSIQLHRAYANETFDLATISPKQL